MSEREILIEILNNTRIQSRTLAEIFYKSVIEKIADSLLDNGVIVPPVKIGQTVYVIPKYNGNPYCGVQQDKVQMIGKTSRGIHIKTRSKSSFNKTYMFGKTAFLTKSEAQKALKGGAE